MKGGCARDAVGLQVEVVDLLLAREGAAEGPGDALGRDALVDAQPFEDLQALLRIADTARRCAAHADGVVFVEQHGAHAALREVAGQREARGAGADDHDGVAHDLRAAQFGRWREGPDRQLVGRRESEVFHVSSQRVRATRRWRPPPWASAPAAPRDSGCRRRCRRCGCATRPRPSTHRACSERSTGRPCRSAAASAPWCARGLSARRPASATTIARETPSARWCAPSRWPSSSPAGHRPTRCPEGGRWGRATGPRSADRHACDRR